MFASFVSANQSYLLGAFLFFVVIGVLLFASFLNSPRDPWAMQRDLMLRSNQKMPTSPELNNTSLLYYALILEDSAKLGVAIAEALAESNTTRNLGHATGPIWIDDAMIHKIIAVAEVMDTNSKRIRKMTEAHGTFVVEMNRAATKKVLDGTTDIAVVNSGFSVGSGLPGGEAYSEVYSSNRSKANPDTGMIDKTSDGKWIKGSNYKEPDYDYLLDFQEDN